MKIVGIEGRQFVDGEWWYYGSSGKRRRLKKKKCSDCGREYFTPSVTTGRCKRCANKGVNNPRWKGGKIKKKSGNARALKLFLKIGDCEKCAAPASVRHHIDRNTLNNAPENIKILCHKCHNREHYRGCDSKGRFI